MNNFVDIWETEKKKKKKNWDIIAAKIIKNLYGSKEEKVSSRITVFPEASFVTASGSGSGSSSASECIVSLPLLTGAEKENIAARYASLDSSKMRKLSTGTIVEEKMREQALKQNHEQ